MRRLWQFLIPAFSLVAMLPNLGGAATFTVKNTNDSGADSLRQALLAANLAVGADTIDFAIPGPGVHTITLLSTLPQITGQVTIDGYTQPGASANTLAAGDNAVLLVVINGNSASVHGFYLVGAASGSSVIRGLAFNGVFLGPPALSGAAIRIEQSDFNLITGNFVGIAVDGATAAGGSDGVQVVNGSSNTIGGSTPAERNLVSGNIEGIEIRTQAAPSGPTVANTNQIEGNYIGTNAAGTAAVGNGSRGIHLGFQVTNTNIGLGIAGSGNLISGNSGSGIEIEDSTGTFVQGNLIGTDRAGTAAIANGGSGIVLRTGASGSQIGGNTVDERNVISGNSNGGIRIQNISPGNSIQGNFIGVDASGLVAMGNGGPGISVVDASDNTVIGGPAGNTGNVIAFNGGEGVAVGMDEAGLGVLRVAILGNRIFSNGALGIDLLAGGVAGVTPNNPDPSPGQPNLLQNFPLLTAAVPGAGTVSISGTLNSAPDASYRIELFASATCDPSGFGEGQSYLGFTDASTDVPAGNASFGPLSLATPAGQPFITATATDSVGNTSEFSQCFASAGAPAATIPTLSQGALGLLAAALALASLWLLGGRRVRR